MIELVEQAILTQLGRIKVGPTTPITVLPPEDYRTLGDAKLPCIALSRYLSPTPDRERTIAHHEIFTPSDTTRRITPKEAWGNAFTQWAADNLPDGIDYLEGPEFWVKQYAPTPYILHYQVDVFAYKKEHRDAIELLVMNEALHERWSPLISGFYVNVSQEGIPANLDELEDPLFRSAFRYEITNVWLPRLQSEQVASIGEITMEGQTTTQSLDGITAGEVDAEKLGIRFGI